MRVGDLAVRRPMPQFRLSMYCAAVLVSFMHAFLGDFRCRFRILGDEKLATAGLIVLMNKSGRVNCPNRVIYQARSGTLCGVSGVGAGEKAQGFVAFKNAGASPTTENGLVDVVGHPCYHDFGLVYRINKTRALPLND